VTWVPYRENIAHMLEPAFVPEGWLTAQIPEDIHATLRRAGLVRGHFYGKDPAEDSWIEEKDWVYYRSFCPDEDGPESGQERGPLIMDFEGLDTFSEVYLNGECVAGGDNMFVPVTADVSGKVRFGQRNVLLVRIRSAVKETEGTDYSALFSHMAFDRIPVRKAQMNYGWDFCERSVTAGIWKEVSLYDRPACCIQDYYLYTASLTQEEAVLYLQATAAFRDREGPGQENEEAKYSFTAELGGEGGCKARAEGSLETFRNGIRLPVSSPELWWPRPYGKPYLYDFTLTLYRGDRPEDCRKQKFGIRTVRLLQERTAEGRSFRFIVNGRQLFIRGSNWVPLDVVYTDIPDDRYDAMIRYAVQGRLSMLRIWGGGIYENERLFRLCDENGIMIWNDFMFACGIYPQDECFLRNVAGEASWAIRKYRNFTCLVLWAGQQRRRPGLPVGRTGGRISEGQDRTRGSCGCVQRTGP
jgi:beta-mannosidase